MRTEITTADGQKYTIVHEQVFTPTMIETMEQMTVDQLESAFIVDADDLADRVIRFS